MGWWIEWRRTLYRWIGLLLGQQPPILPTPADESQSLDPVLPMLTASSGDGARPVVVPTVPIAPKLLPLPLKPDGSRYQYHAFISYARVDQRKVQRILDELEPAGLKLFHDQKSIQWGESLQVAIDQGLTDSRYVIVCLSTAALASDWMTYERLVAQAEDVANRSRRVLHVLLEDIDPAILPVSVRAYRYLRCRTPTEISQARASILHTVGGRSRSPEETDLPYVTLGDVEDELVQRYRAQMVEEHGSFEVPGIGEELPYRFMLTQAWVTLNADAFEPELRHRAGSAEEAALCPPSDRRENVPLHEAFLEVRRLNKAIKSVVIVGDPGSGKTTWLKHMLLRCVDEGSAALGLPPGLLPVYLPLRSLQSTTSSIDVFIAEEFARNPHLVELGQVGQSLKTRAVLLLLDGLDEVLSAGTRTRVETWIQQANARAGWYVAVTTRYTGWVSGSLGSGFVELRVKALGEVQIQEFIRNWLEAYFVRKLKAEEALTKARREAVTLWEQLKEDRPRSRRLMSMSGNPLLLANLCRVQVSQGELPRRRDQLYQRCVALLLEQWHSRKGLPSVWAQHLGLDHLSYVAWRLTLVNETLVAEETLLGWLEERDPTATTQEVKEETRGMLRAIRDISGILVGWSEDRYGFLHRTFQEYLAAVEICRRGEVAELAQRLGQPGWEEIVPLALAVAGSRGDSDAPTHPVTEFFRRLITGPNFPPADVLSVYECLDEVAKPCAAPFVEVLGTTSPQLPWEARYTCLNLMQGRFTHQSPQIVAALQALFETPPPWLPRLKPETAAPIRTLATILLQQRGAPVPGIRPTPMLEAERKVGDVYIHMPGVLDLEMVWVPHGTFMMGSDDGDDDEKPIHEVTLSQGYWLSRTPITNAHYRRFVEKVGHRPSGEDGNTRFNAPDQPVVGVNWEDGQAFCTWAGLKLPTEAQWEWAARGPEGRTYPWSDGEPTPKLANYAGEVGRTSAVGSYPLGASWVGALDMAGNVWEWCQDWFGPYPPGEQVDPTVPDGHLSNRVVRGGWWDGGTTGLRGSVRGSWIPSWRGSGIGFRVALPPGHE